MHKELSKQAKLIDEAEKYQKERNIILADNEALNERVKLLEHEYKKKNNLEIIFENNELRANTYIYFKTKNKEGVYVK